VWRIAYHSIVGGDRSLADQNLNTESGYDRYTPARTIVMQVRFDANASFPCGASMQQTMVCMSRMFFVFVHAFALGSRPASTPLDLAPAKIVHSKDCSLLGWCRDALPLEREYLRMLCKDPWESARCILHDTR
jgi:hypothetical protein